MPLVAFPSRAVLAAAACGVLAMAGSVPGQVAPEDQEICPGGTAVLTLVLADDQPGASCTWAAETHEAPGVFFPLANGPLGECGWVSGAGTPELHLSWSGQGLCGSSIRVKCLVANGCEQVETAAVRVSVCAADFNCSGVTSVQDIFDFLAAFFAGDPSADFNGAGGISVQDIFDFLGAYFGGCA